MGTKTRAQQESVQKRHGKTAADWDKRAADFAKNTAHSSYSKKFLDKLKPQASWSVLDVGAGPGTLALPLASQVKEVSCLDFSAQMLAILQQKAGEQGLSNISTHKLSWTDDWQAHGLVPHDVVIASRALAVDDLSASLAKLSRFAKEKVAITDRVEHGPHDPHAFAAVGRQLPQQADYKKTLQVLREQGHEYSLDFIELSQEKTYANREEIAERYQWMFSNLSPEEEKKLSAYLDSIATINADQSITIRPQYTTAWAYISWPTRTSASPE